MRRSCFRAVALLALLVAVFASPPPARGIVFCYIVNEECVACGPDLSKKCTYRQCTDGTSQTSCTQCSLFCYVS